MGGRIFHPSILPPFHASARPRQRFQLRHEACLELHEPRADIFNAQIRQHLQRGFHAIDANGIEHTWLIASATALKLNFISPTERDLTITVTKRESVVSIKVTDNGPGFSDEAIQQLYKRHRSTKGAGHLGMGLYIAKRMMNHLGGEIEAVNRPGGAGSEVTLTFKDLCGYEDRNGDN